MLTDELKQRIQGAYSHLLQSKSLKPRYGQKLMMAEVARTLASPDVDSDGRRVGEAPVCVVEAGTGTGKTIAYTLAAIPVAQALGKTLVISTATVALQEQIVYKDLPDILHHSGLQFKFALAKGRGRYLCLSKLDGLLQDSNASNETLALYPDEIPLAVDQSDMALYENMLASLARGDWDGDRDSWPQELDGSQWSRVTTDHAQCTGRRCSNISQCSFYKAREQVTKVDVIVTNHDLVLADLSLGGGAILPEPEDCIYIFDEGHHLPDKAINHFAQFSRVHSTERWLEQCVKALSKAAPSISNYATAPHLQRLPELLQRLKSHHGMLFSSLESMVDIEPDRRGNHQYHRFEQGIVPAGLVSQAVELHQQFRQVFDLFDNVCNVLEECLEEDGEGITRLDAEAWFPPLSMMRSRAEANMQLWGDYSRATEAQTPPQGRWVAVVEGAGGNLDFEVASSPIMAASTLRYYLWSRCFAAVITSATLTALGKFDRFRYRAGPPDGSSYSVVPSPFDFAGAGVLAVPAMACDPSDAEAHTDAVVELLPELLKDHLGSLVLFSSRRQLEQVYEALPETWQHKIIRQGGYSKQEVVRKHRQAVDDKQQSVIFGLASFAEGVDLPGAYCTHVVIAKIPFGVPDQPVEAALAEWIESRGGNPFMDISVPDAAIKLVQASGRLLRTERDSGIVTLLDRRIVTRRYGKAMLDSLPPFSRQLS
jgi:ATP-dependent DNA helicase DinG